MRRYGIVLAAVALGTLPALAQTPPGAPPTPAAPADAASAALDAHLLKWEQSMKKVEALSAVLNRVDKDVVLDSTRKYSGNAIYLRAGTGGPGTQNQAMLEMREEGKRDFAEKFVCTGTFLYQFVPASKEIRSYELPKPKPGQVADDNFLSFLFGMKAEEARRRYLLTPDNDPKHPGGEDKWYIYVNVTPRERADRAEFTQARLVLDKTTFLPRQLWFKHPNGNQTTWDIPTLRRDVNPDPRLFDTPAVPTGWKMVTVPTNPPPSAPGAPAPPRPSGAIRP
jgi:TIGR03009 family protein